MTEREARRIIHASRAGKLGGRVRSPAKQEAARQNLVVARAKKLADMKKVVAPGPVIP
jgi:hypothetical protein